MCLLGQVLQEQRVHRPLEADVQVRDVAFGEGDDAHAGERETLEEPGGVLLVTAESIERLGQYHVEFAPQRGGHQRLESRAQKCGPGDRVIGELAIDAPVLPLRERPTDPNLIRNRGVPLIIR